MVEREFPEVTLVRNNENRGFATANNQGIKKCLGRYILLLNSDTIILGDVLHASIDFMDHHKEFGAMGCQVLNADQSIQSTCSGYPTLFRLLSMTIGFDRIPGLSFFDSYLLRSWDRNTPRDVEVISGCYLLFKQKILETVGNLDERFFFFAEETDWCRRIRKNGWRLCFAPVGQIIHYGGGSVKSLNYKRDVMLTAATVKLHQKYGGRLAKISSYIILMMFNASRAFFWWFLFTINKKHSPRKTHFFNVVRAYRDCWPK